MANLNLAVVCGPYDRTEALKTGQFRADGIDLDVVSIQSPRKLIKA